MGELSEALTEFSSDVERVEHLLKLIKAFRAFGSSAPSSGPEASASSWPEAAELVELATKIRTDLPVLSGSIQLYLCGRFEYFVRQIVERTAEAIAAQVDSYSSLPETLRKEMRSRTIEVAQNPTRYGYTELQVDGLLSDLLQNMTWSRKTSSDELIVNSQVLSITESNMNARTLAEVVKRIGIVEYWKEVGKQNPMKIVLSANTDGDCTVQAQTRLTAVMEERNQIAHPTGSTSFPDPDRVLGTSEFLLCLARVTHELATLNVAKHRSFVA